MRALVDEGRTVMLSSHILDEVEKTCDQVAIVDQGEIVAMGSLDELRGGGQPRVLIAVDREREALRLLAGAPGVAKTNLDDGVIHVTLADADAIPDLNRRLVEAGIRVRRLEPVHASLEERFLAITTRLEDTE